MQQAVTALESDTASDQNSLVLSFNTNFGAVLATSFLTAVTRPIRQPCLAILLCSRCNCNETKFLSSYSTESLHPFQENPISDNQFAEFTKRTAK